MTAEDYFERGNQHYAHGNITRAIDYYNQAINSDPNYSLVYSNRGFAYNRLGEKNLAIDDYNKAIQLNPNERHAYNNRGYCYANQGLVTLAFADYDKAIALSPDFSSAYSNRGNSHYYLGEIALALADYDRVLQLDSTDAVVHASLKVVRAEQTKSKLFDAIKQLPIETKIRFLTQCLNEDTEWGKKFRRTEGLYEKIFGCEEMLFEMQQYLSALEKPIVIWSFLIVPELIANQGFCGDILFHITSYFLQVSGLKFSTVDRCMPMINQLQSTMFFQKNKMPKEENNNNNNIKSIPVKLGNSK